MKMAYIVFLILLNQFVGNLLTNLFLTDVYVSEYQHNIVKLYIIFKIIVGPRAMFLPIVKHQQVLNDLWPTEDFNKHLF